MKTVSVDQDRNESWKLMQSELEQAIGRWKARLRSRIRIIRRDAMQGNMHKVDLQGSGVLTSHERHG